MKLPTLIFDSKNNNWEDSREPNHMFLLCTERYINDIIRCRGYIYLNQIYEQLGIKWDPDKENLCIKNDGTARLRYIEFEVFDQSDNSCYIVIHHYE